MLVLEPSRRYTAEQIRKHRWLQQHQYNEPQHTSNSEITAATNSRPTSQSSEPNEQILRLMQSLGIDQTKTKEVSLTFIKIHLGIYHLFI